MTAVGEEISRNGVPSAPSPLIFVFTGNGNVSKGAQEIFRLLPHEFVSAADLPMAVQDKRFGNKLVGCIVGPEDYMERREGGGFAAPEYYSKPTMYRSTFHERIAPFASVIVNGIYWDDRFPRLLTKKQAVDSCPRLLAVCDISCDIGVPMDYSLNFIGID